MREELHQILRMTPAFADDDGHGQELRRAAFVDLYRAALTQPRESVVAELAHLLETTQALARDAGIDWARIEDASADLAAARTAWRRHVSQSVGITASPGPATEEPTAPRQPTESVTVHAYYTPPHSDGPLVAPDGSRHCDGPMLDVPPGLVANAKDEWSQGVHQPCEACLQTVLEWIAEPAFPLDDVWDFYWVTEEGEKFELTAAAAVGEAWGEAEEQGRPEPDVALRYAQPLPAELEWLHWEPADTTVVYLTEALEHLDLWYEDRDHLIDRLRQSPRRAVGGGHRRDVGLRRNEAEQLLATGLIDPHHEALADVKELVRRPALATRDLQRLAQLVQPDLGSPPDPHPQTRTQQGLHLIRGGAADR